jgi:hypothetical protein
MAAKTCKTVETTWEVYIYNVWGNAKDGYEVNDVYHCGEIEMDCSIDINNPGTSFEFESAFPSNSQIREVFGLKCSFATDGDDLIIYVNRAKDSYPIGELRCISHKSLSPIQPL